MSREVAVALGARSDLAPAARHLTCAAPTTSLHLDALGDVRACCQNSWFRLGRIPDQTLREIWDGPAAQELRDRLAAGDLSAGCDACRPGSLASPDGAPYARAFDHLAEAAVAGWPVQLELALSNRCNLACTMCSGLYSSTIRAQREHLPPLESPYGDAFFEELRGFLPHLRRIELLGGEPFLSPEVHRLVALLDELALEPLLHITTNGTVWTPWVEQLLHRHRVDITVSIDAATPETYEQIRVGASFERVVENLRRFVAVAAGRSTSVTIATCTMQESIADLHGVLALADELDVAVYTNAVTAPARSSLATASRDDLAAWADHLAARGRERPLGRNAAVLDREVAALRRLAESAPSGPIRAADDLLAAAAAELAAWVTPDSPPPARFAVDGGMVLTGIEPDPGDVFGLDLRACLGLPTSAWMDPLRARYGELRSSSVVHRPEGLADWTLLLGPEHGGAEIRAIRAPEGDGERWVVALRPPPR